MTTTEFIKLIKDCQADRKRLYTSHWNYTDPVCIVSESELEKIEKVNVELLDSLKYAYTLLLQQADAGRYPEKALAENGGEGYTPIASAIKNASNIKQI